MASGVPGVPEQIDEDYLVRRIKALERRVDELGPSLMLASADAISTAVNIQSITNFAISWGLPGTEQVLVSQTATVPDGFTKASLFVSTTLSVLGVAGSGNSYIRARSGVDSHLGVQSTAYLYDTDAITITAESTADLVGLTAGGTITVNGYGVALAGAKPASASNTAVINALVLWSR